MGVMSRREPFGRARPQSEVVFRMRFCRATGCGRVIWICRICDRGQCYCGDVCRQRARREQRPAANGRVPKDRARPIRPSSETMRLSATPGSRDGSWFPPITRPTEGSPGGPGGVRVGNPGRSSCLLFCALCHRQGRFVEPFPGRRYRRIRTTTGDRSKKYVFQ